MKKLVLIFIALIAFQTIIAQEQPGKVKEKILRAVVKIEIPIKKTGKQPNGTGFIVSRPLNESSARQFFLVTNKHIVGDWNMADGNIINYYPKIDVFLYTNGIKDTSLFISKSINLTDNIGNITPKLKLHPNQKVDISIIDITDEINATTDLNIVSFDISYLGEFKNIYKGMFIGMGDQVFAIGYPMGITSQYSNLPIAKSGYISSLPGEEFQVEVSCPNRAKKNIETIVKGKLLIVDGLIVGGNSGSPVVLPSEVRFKLNEKSGFQYTKGPLENIVLGIVSSNIGNSGINIVYSSDYIKELINEF